LEKLNGPILTTRGPDRFQKNGWYGVEGRASISKIVNLSKTNKGKRMLGRGGGWFLPRKKSQHRNENRLTALTRQLRKIPKEGKVRGVREEVLSLKASKGAPGLLNQVAGDGKKV